MFFWIIASLAGLATAGVLIRAAMRGGEDGADAARAVVVYKHQLREVENDLARGVLTGDEAQTLRTEVSRRLLAAADEAADAGRPAPAGATRAMTIAATALVLGGGIATYAFIGAPGAPDRPLAARIAESSARYAERPSQAEFLARLEEDGVAPDPLQVDDPEQAALLEQLREVLAERPDDLRGHILLAQNMARLGNWSAAAAAQEQVIRIRGSEADADDHTALAEYLILAVNGYVSPEAERALTAALRADPRNPVARYYSGLSAVQAGRPDLAYDLWTRLLSEGPEAAPWVRAIRAQIDQVALAAGRPVPERGPSGQDIDAAAAMDPAARQEMIEGMVAGLSDRLSREGGPAEDWARLIRAYGVLGERAQANRVWQEAREVFADAPADLALIRQAARDAEVLQ